MFVWTLKDIVTVVLLGVLVLSFIGIFAYSLVKELVERIKEKRKAKLEKRLNALFERGKNDEEK